MKKIIELIKEYDDLRNTQLKINMELKEQTSELVINLLREKLKEVNNKVLEFENMELYTKEEYNSNIKYVERTTGYRDDYNSYSQNRNSYYNNGYDWNNRNEW
jgi:hypothetical protein